MNADVAEDERAPWGRLETRGCWLAIITRSALIERGIRTLEHQYMVATDTNGKKLSIAVNTLADLRTLVPTLCPARIEIFCTPAERAELRSIVLAVQSVHQFVESLH